MIREFNGQRLYLSCISAGRPSHVARMHELVGPLTWYVPKVDWEAYLSAGAKDIREGSNTNAPQARNRALRDAWNLDLPCAQLDDDMRWAKRKDFETGEVVKITGEEALARVLTVVNASDFKLGGIPNTNNPFFSRAPMTTNTHIRSHMWIVKPCGLFLDEELDAKYDYDYTLQHIKEFFGVCRVDEVICDFDYGTVKGGHVATRHRVSQERDILRLERRWGTKIIRRNPRRPGEIIIHPPKGQRVTI